MEKWRPQSKGPCSAISFLAHLEIPDLAMSVAEWKLVTYHMA